MGSAFYAEPLPHPALVDEVVTCCLSDPSLVVHMAHLECGIEGPHKFDKCPRVTGQEPKPCQ